MTEGRAFAARLRAAGLDEVDVPAKGKLFDTVLDACRRITGAEPVAAWWVPGRLEVFGTHTDYAGGRSLVAALPRGFAFAVSPRADGIVRAVDAAGGEHAEIDPARAPGRFRGWRHYLEVAAGRLARNFPDAALGADVVFASDLPRAAGTSSSSALVVGVVTSLVHVAGLRARPAWQENIRSTLDEAGYLACVENGRTFGTLAGDEGVGTHGGSEDHAAMLTAAPGACSAYAFVPLRHLETVAIPGAWTIAVASSGVRADKTGTVQGAYNRLANGADVLLRLWNAHADTLCSSLASALATSPDALDVLHEIIGRSRIPGWTAVTLRDRLDHFAREDARVAASVDVFHNADLPELGVLAEASQNDAEERLKNQVPETTLLVGAARAAGAAAARSFGAGFGGSVWAVFSDGAGGRDDAEAEMFVQRWLSAYRASCDAGTRSMAFIARPGPPLTAVLS